MAELFLKIVNMSISATWLVLAVLLVRFFLKKAPNWVHVLLWGIVAVRLICPFSIESALSLIPSGEVISPDIMMDRTPEITTGIPAINSFVNPIISESFTPALGDSANPLQIWISVAAQFWFLGILIMVIFTAVSYLRLRRHVRTAGQMYENIYQSARIPSPFVLGIIRPRIYLPYGLKETDMPHVIAHEQTHIRRKDHWWKPLGFLLLTIHWFNPLMWVAYVLLCRDIELACDEKVIAQLGHDQRADYSQTLLECSVNRAMIAACPLAFGEVGVKERVKNVLNYKKPAFWIIVTAVALCVIVAVCFLTDPAPGREFTMEGDNVADLDPQWIISQLEEITGTSTDSGFLARSGYSLMLNADFDWVDAGAIPFSYSAPLLRGHWVSQLRLFYEDDQFYVTEPSFWERTTVFCRLVHYLEALKYMPQAEIRALAPEADRYVVDLVDSGVDGRGPDSFENVITYTQYGVGNMYGWYAHLELQPLHETGGAYSGSGDEVIHLFYGNEEAETLSTVIEWVDFYSTDRYPEANAEEMILPHFDDATFRYLPGEINVTDENGQSALITGMPIWNAYFEDLTGDGKPEICATVSFGSGMIDTHVVVYDYANHQEYTLWDRGNFDYSIRLERGKLVYDKKTYPDGTVIASGELTLAELQPRETVMVPTDANMHGIFDRYLYRTIDGKNYRYERQSEIPAGLTRGDYLETVQEDTGLGTVYQWDLYAVEGCNDNTMVMAQSAALSGLWLYQYSPSKRAAEGALEEAREAGYVIQEDGRLTGGEDAWLAFYEAAQQGKPASVTLAHYYTLDRSTTASMTYEAYREDYPMLILVELSYDGEVYTIRDEGQVKTYEYLMKYTGRNIAVSSSQADEYTHYVLTHDNTVTWDQLWSSLLSSASGAYIDHYTVCTKLY